MKNLQNKILLVEISLTTSYYQDLITALYESDIDFAIEDYTHYLYGENREMSRIWIDRKDQLMARHLLKKVTRVDKKYAPSKNATISYYILAIGAFILIFFYLLSYFGWL